MSFSVQSSWLSAWNRETRRRGEFLPPDLEVGKNETNAYEWHTIVRLFCAASDCLFNLSRYANSIMCLVSQTSLQLLSVPWNTGIDHKMGEDNEGTIFGPDLLVRKNLNDIFHSNTNSCRSRQEQCFCSASRWIVSNVPSTGPSDPREGVLDTDNSLALASRWNTIVSRGEDWNIFNWVSKKIVSYCSSSQLLYERR